MKSLKIHSYNQEETKKLGERIARHLNPGDIICLFGDLGSGKTTLVKGLAKGLCISPVNVNSPTFVLMNVYEGKLPLFHFDFYRLEKPEELLVIGYEEFLYGDGVAVIEWAERFGDLMPREELNIHLSYLADKKMGRNDEQMSKKEQERLIKVTAKGERYNKLLEELK